MSTIFSKIHTTETVMTLIGSGDPSSKATNNPDPTKLNHMLLWLIFFILLSYMVLACVIAHNVINFVVR